MGVIVENMREIHQLGAATREWLVSGKRVPGFGATHTRIAGYTEARADYAFVRHDPAFSMILVTESGHGRVVLDGEWVECSTGQAYVTAPRVPHAYHIKPGSRWRLHWVIYEETANLPTLAAGTPPRLVACEAGGLRHAVEGLCGENAGRAEPGALGLWAALIDRMVLRVLKSEKSEPRLERLWAQVREDLGGEWSLSRMALCAGMSEENLRRLCLRLHQRAPMAQLTWMRMQTAADILAHSEGKLGELATRLGYADAFAFSTAFKRVMGRSPREFRPGRVSPA
ncbi:MAG TPA: AraC family transcriptional regulator [Opitutaceae bacterium]|nr:AraC family transcriptional regulator [Opitutaceae bacterium]